MQTRTGHMIMNMSVCGTILRLCMEPEKNQRASVSWRALSNMSIASVTYPSDNQLAAKLDLCKIILGQDWLLIELP